MNVSALTINDLKSISAKEAATQNAVLLAVGGRLYEIAGQSVLMQLGQSNGDALKVALQFNGQNILLGLSESLVNALLKDEGGSVANLNADILNLVIRLKLLPKLPQGVQLSGVYLNGDVLPEPLQALPRQVTLQAVAPQTQELMGWTVEVSSMPQTSLGAFLKCFDFLVGQKLPSPLLKAKVPMPLIAATTSVSAEQLRDIAVGDVILIA